LYGEIATALRNAPENGHSPAPQQRLHFDQRDLPVGGTREEYISLLPFEALSVGPIVIDIVTMMVATVPYTIKIARIHF